MITRRLFLKRLAGAIAVAVALPLVITPRQPYVIHGDVLDYIGRCPGFIGGKLVKEIRGWTGKCYPVIASYGYGDLTTLYSDADLCCFYRELPEKFWWSRTYGQFPNVHSYVRMKRYGETIDQAILALDLFGAEKQAAEYKQRWAMNKWRLD